LLPRSTISSAVGRFWEHYPSLLHNNHMSFYIALRFPHFLPTGPALLDLVSVLLLLAEDLAAEEPGVVTLFQPVIDIRVKLRQFGNQHVRSPPSATAVAAAAAALGMTSQSGGGPPTAGRIAAAAAAAASVATAAAPSNTSTTGADSSPSFGSVTGSYMSGTLYSSSTYDQQYTSPGQGHPTPTPAVATLITKARCPRLVAARPVSCIASTLSGECAQVAGSIAKTVMTQGQWASCSCGQVRLTLCLPLCIRLYSLTLPHV
jgi:hypothetical protein